MKRKEPVDYRGYPVRPRKLTPLAWFYESSDGISVVQQPAEGIPALMTRITWKRLEAAVNRHQTAKRARR